MNKYEPRFIADRDIPKLIDLYHLARTALSGKIDTPHERKIWASKEFAKENPYVSSTGAYKDLCGLLEQTRIIGLKYL